MSDEWKCVNAHDRCYGGAGGACDYCERVWPSPEMTPWKIAMEAAADEVAEHLSTPEDVAWAEDAASRILSLPMPPAFRTAVEAEAGVIRADRAASVRLWQDAAAEAEAAQAETKRTSKMLEEAQEMLEQYQKDLCEGFCRDLPAGFYEPDMSIDCGGCRARALLSRLEAKGESHE